MNNLTYRDTLEGISPSWLKGTWLGRFMYAFGVHFDMLVEMAVRAVWLRFPRMNAAVSALTWIGRDRGIVRGFDEPDASYAERCARWIVDRRRKGSPYALMRQVQGYLTGHSVAIDVVNQKGHWHRLAADGTESWWNDRSGAHPWNWAMSATGASLWYLIIHVPATLWTINPNFDVNEHGTVIPWGDTTRVMGFTATRAQVDTIKMLVREWGCPHAQCEWIVFAFTDATFVPAANITAWTGSYANWGLDYAGGKIRARHPSARYVSGRQYQGSPHGV